LKLHSGRAQSDWTGPEQTAAEWNQGNHEENQGVNPVAFRMIGLFPILQSHVFDMVSSGQEFKLWIPPKNQFIVGNNDVARPSTKPLENLRPQVIYDALLLQPVDLQNELAVLEEGEHMGIDRETQKPVLQPDYTLDIIKQNGQAWYLSRKTVFDRTDLQPPQQVLFDNQRLHYG
jgi:hypothetical protein